MVYYPAKIDTDISLTPINDGHPISSSILEKLRLTIIDIEKELGIKPSGTYSTVRARLDALETALNNLQNISLAGDLGGTLNLQKVIGLQGNPLSNADPDLGDALTWNGIAWVPGTVSGGGGGTTFGGDLTIIDLDTIQYVIGLQGRPISGLTPNSGDALVWDGSAWTPTAISGGGPTDVANVGTGTGLILKDISGSTIEARNIYAGTGISVSTIGDNVLISSSLSSLGNGTTMFTGSQIRTLAAGDGMGVTVDGSGGITLTSQAIVYHATGISTATQTVASGGFLRIPGPVEGGGGVTFLDYGTYTVLQLPALTDRDHLWQITYQVAMSTATNHNWVLAYGSVNDLSTYSTMGDQSLVTRKSEGTGSIVRGTATFIYHQTMSPQNRYIAISNQSIVSCQAVADGGPSVTIVATRIT